MERSDSGTMEIVRRIAALERARTELETRVGVQRGGGDLLAAVLATHFGAGGPLIEGWLADSPQAFGYASAANWTLSGTHSVGAAYGGGPLWLLGGASYLYINDASWQEPGNQDFLVWRWAYIGSLASGTDQVIIGKWLPAGDNRAWRLFYSFSSGAFAFSVSSLGTAASVTTVTSSHSFSTQKIYFVAAYKGSSEIGIYVGLPTEAELTEDTAALASPAVYDGSAPLTMGADGGGASLLNGSIGVGATRRANLATPISYLELLFRMTRRYYLDATELSTKEAITW